MIEGTVSEVDMRKFALLALIAVVVCSSVSLALLGSHFQKERAARAGLERSTAQLPHPSKFVTIKEFEVEMWPVFDTEIGEPCYFGRGYSVFGTSLPETEALDVYVAQLQEFGWLTDGKQYENERALIRGKNELLVVHTDSPSVDIQDAVVYTKLRETFRTVVFVRVTYMLPRREGC
jgi:hypothetical protein